MPLRCRLFGHASRHWYETLEGHGWLSKSWIWVVRCRRCGTILQTLGPLKNESSVLGPLT